MSPVVVISPVLVSPRPAAADRVVGAAVRVVGGAEVAAGEGEQGGEQSDGSRHPSRRWSRPAWGTLIRMGERKASSSRPSPVRTLQCLIILRLTAMPPVLQCIAMPLYCEQPLQGVASRDIKMFLPQNGDSTQWNGTQRTGVKVMQRNIRTNRIFSLLSCVDENYIFLSFKAALTASSYIIVIETISTYPLVWKRLEDCLENKTS